MLTRILIAINVIAFIWEQTSGALNTNASLEAHGGLVGADVLAGQWWRIVTSAFLHASITHIAFNMFALYQVGSFVELIYGTPRTAVIYAIAAFGGGIAVTLLAPDIVTIGASGAIFGLFGALAVAGLRLGKPGRDILRQTTGIIVINLIISFFPGSNISWQDHLGGLITGALAGALLFRVPRQRAVAVENTTGVPYAQRIDARSDPGVITIEHAPTTDPSTQPPHP